MNTALGQRRIPFAFDETTPYMWLPSRPEFAHLCNLFSVLAPGLERYIVSTMRDAMPLITDPAAKAEAEGFLKQEARHAAAHVHHLKALIPRYPGLQEVLDASNAAFDEINTTESIEYRTAFIAVLEGTFTPFFKVFLDHHDVFFEPGDDRVASLFLWHFVEEVEHRSSAMVVYNDVVGSDWYRIKTFPKALARSARIVFEIAEGLDRVIPEAERIVSAKASMKSAGGTTAFMNRLTRRRGRGPDMLADVPTGEILRMIYRELKAQAPGHDPEHQPLPAYADTWLAGYDRGLDVTRWYSSNRPAA